MTFLHCLEKLRLQHFISTSVADKAGNTIEKEAVKEVDKKKKQGVKKRKGSNRKCISNLIFKEILQLLPP